MFMPQSHNVASGSTSQATCSPVLSPSNCMVFIELRAHYMATVKNVRDEGPTQRQIMKLGPIKESREPAT